MNPSLARIEPLFGCGMAGILYATSGIERVVPIVHGAMSCASGHRIIPLFADKEPLVATTSLTEMDIIMGTEDRLREAILKAQQIYQPDLITVVLTCATSLTGEVSSSVARSLGSQLTCPVFVVDGSGIVTDEQAGYADFTRQFDALTAQWGVEGRAEDGCELAGISASDFAVRKDLAALDELLQSGAGRAIQRALYVDVKLDRANWVRWPRLNAGRFWLRDEQPAPAPFGAAGARAWLAWAAARLGAAVAPAFTAACDQAAAELERLRHAQKYRHLRIGIEGASWWALGLARFLAEEAGCEAVLVSSDEGAVQYQQRFGAVAETVVDMGSTELADRFREFGADLVFGSSYVKAHDWVWAPFWQAVWHVVPDEPSRMGLGGIPGLLALLDAAYDHNHANGRPLRKLGHM